MVSTKLLIIYATLFFCLLGARPAWALFGQTQRDLAVLEDALRYRFESEPALKERVIPMLLAPPKNVWQESRTDFPAAALNVLKAVFPEPNSVIVCPDCDTHRLHVTDHNAISINNGELALGDLSRMRQDPRFKGARSFATVKETPAGVEMRIINLDDGGVLFFALADSAASLDGVKPYLHLSRELERRRYGESLAYIWFNMGLYPKGTFQLEYLEQWGKYNQHLSGVVLSLFNPTFALGAVYHYMLPSMRKLNFQLALFYPLQNALGSAVGDNQSVVDKFVLQGGVHYAFSSTFGVFALGNSDSTLSLGISLFNPLLVPFML